MFAVWSPILQADAEQYVPFSQGLLRDPRVEHFWVQVGAFRLAEKAMEAATALRDQTVSLFATPDDPLLRVVVGPFGNREAATSKLREIRARGYGGFISGPTR